MWKSKFGDSYMTTVGHFWDLVWDSDGTAAVYSDGTSTAQRLDSVAFHIQPGASQSVA